MKFLRIIKMEAVLVTYAVLCDNVNCISRFVACLCKCDNPCTEEVLDQYPTVST